MMTARCDGKDPGRPRCTGQPTTPVLVGCVHEHFETGNLCDRHLGAELGCYRCWQVDGHKCVLRQSHGVTR